MEPRCTRLKGFRAPALGAALLLAGLAWLGACASAPSPPGDENHAPIVNSIEVVGARPKLAAGTLNVQLEVETVDLDGDALTLTWSGPGVFHNVVVEPGGGSVRWNLPADEYGDLNVVCRASDGVATDSLVATFSVGRALTTADYGDLVGGTITWSEADTPFYVLVQDVEIPAGVTLAIAAGTEIWCEEDTRLTIGGSLVASGTSSQRVVFQPNSTETTEVGFWNGIYFASSGGSFALTYCSIENAATAVNLELGTGLGAQLESCYLYACTVGVKVGFGAIELLGCTVDSFGKGLIADHAEVAIANCNFNLGNEESLSLRSLTSGTCEGCFFTDVGAPIVSISGGSRVDLHGNRFFGDGLAVLVGAGYGGAPEPLDARCNYWGDGAGDADIVARIDYAGADSAPVIYTPWQATQGAACGDEDPPVIEVELRVVYDARHPLYGAPPPLVDLSTMALDGYPRLLEVTVEPQHDGFIHAYTWSASAGGTLFVAGQAWPLGDDFVENYLGQQDAVAGSAIFFVPAGAGGETVSVTITDNWGQAVGSTAIFTY